MDKIERIKILIKESLNELNLSEEDLDEERIANREAKLQVQNCKNFIGSHVYGENLGTDGEPSDMYVAYSYNSDIPLFIYDRVKDVWYRNTSNYNNPDGTPNKFIEKHRQLLRPNVESQGRLGSLLKKVISRFKKAHGIGENSHSDLKPGEK